jgi:serine/threonine protein kinase/WD40 repeat protein/tetratricopeptide (TPR) repeat protein
MSPRVPVSAALPPADPAFDLLVDGLIARLQAGEAVDWPEVAREHPEYAGRLRSLAPALQALGDLSSAGDAALSGVAPAAEGEDLVPGVLGDFRLLREVGRGGMGVVYEAEQVSLNRRVALKVLPLAATMDPRQLARFRHEARAAALLHHPHVVPVYGVGCERGVHYYAMQLIEGRSLAAVIDDLRGAGARAGEATGPYPVGEGRADTPPAAGRGTVPSRRGQASFRRVAELIAQAADALEYAHAMGVVHRDIKPANLLLDAGGNVWVTDFGLARLGEGPGLTVSGDLLGTLRYMSPEQALAKHGLVDHRTDVYSLGATLYELLTLRPAVDGASKEEVLHALAFGEPVAPRKLDRSVPAELETVALKALAKKPEERYGTAKEFADDLRRWLDDRPILARPPGPIRRVRKWSHRHRPLVVALAAFLTLLAIGLCVGAVAFGFRERALADERGRFAEEREISERKIAGDLRRVLIGRAEAVRLARPPGYRARVWADLREAVPLPANGGDADHMRATLLACLGDPVGLDPVADPTAVRRQERPVPSDPWVRERANGGPVAASPDGGLIAVAGRPGRATVGTYARRLWPDDTLRVAGRAGRVTVYDREGKPRREEEFPLGAVYDLAIAADNRVLAAGGEQGFVTWDLAGTERWVDRAGNVTSVAISPNGRLLAAGGRQLELWSLVTKRLLASWPAPAAGARVEFSADGRVLLAAVNGAPVAGWPVSETPERRALDGHTAGVPGLAFSPDGRELVSVSKDRTVRVWDAAGGRPVRTLAGHPGEIEAVGFSPDGSLLATGDLTGRLRVWDARSGDLLTEAGQDTPPGQIWRLQFGPGGEYLAAGGGHLVVWAVRAGPGQATLEPICTLGTAADAPGVIDLAARPGGADLVFLNRAGRLYSYDLARADEPRLMGTASVALRSLHFTPAGDRLTLITAGGTLGVWDWERRAAEDTRRRADSVAVSADGRWAAVAEAGRNVTVVEAASGREAFALPPEASDVWSLAWAPDGTKLAAGLSDGAVAVWDLGQVRARLAEFGLDSPSTARPEAAPTPAPVPAFDRVARVNRLRAEAESARRLANEARDAGDHAAERDHLLAALDRDGRLADALSDVPGHRKRLAWTHGALARALAPLGDADGALGHLEAEAGLLQRLLADEPGGPEYRRLLAKRLTDRSRLLYQVGRPAEAVDDARRALAERERLAADTGSPADRENVAVALGNLGLELTHAGQPAEAERYYRESLAARDRLAADVPAQADTLAFREGRGTTLHNLAINLARAGDKGPVGVIRARGDNATAVVRLFREAAAVRTRLADDFPDRPEYASESGRTLEWLGAVLRQLGQFDESARVLREAVRRQRAALDRRPKDRGFRDLCCNEQANLAETLLGMSRPAEAADSARELPRLAPDDPARLLTAARLLARCAARAAQYAGPPWGVGPFLARAYRDEAVALAQSAVAKGLADAAAPLSGPEFDAVRDCPDFRRLLDEVKDRKP